MLDKQYLPVPLNFEKWDDIPDTNGLYQISSLFRFRSFNGVDKGNNPKLLKSKSINSYPKIAILKNGVKKYIRIHNLIADFYIPQDESRIYINHINGNKSNYHPLNLERVTNSENVAHAYKYKLNNSYNKNGDKNPNSILSKNKVDAIRMLFSTGLYSKGFLSKMFNVAKTSISNIIEYKTWRDIEYGR